MFQLKRKKLAWPSLARWGPYQVFMLLSSVHPLWCISQHPTGCKHLLKMAMKTFWSVEAASYHIP